MIDPHVHLRDWNWKHKETIEHGLMVAEKVGLDAVFDMPNVAYHAAGKPIISRELVEWRLRDAKKCNSPVFYGLYVGVTANPEQIKEAVQSWGDFFPREFLGERASVGVVGLKMFAGHSVGDLAVIQEEDQKRVYETLVKEDYEGVLAVHCEKESWMTPEFWKFEDPISHYNARPSVAEIESVRDQISFAVQTGYAIKEKSKGKLHLLHLSTPEAIDLVNSKRDILNISCETTPNHLLLTRDVMRMPNGIMYKVNPPLRALSEQFWVLEKFKRGLIDVLGSDYAPHTLAEKTGKAKDAKGSPQYMSGIPGLSCWPHYITNLAVLGVPEQVLESTFLDNTNVNRIFGTNIKVRGLPETGRLARWEDVQSLTKDYAFNPAEYINS